MRDDLRRKTEDNNALLEMVGLEVEFATLRYDFGMPDKKM